MTYARDLTELMDRAKELGLCGRYAEMWGKARDNMAMAVMATTIDGADFMCASAQNGWGLSSAYIRRVFPDCIDGRPIRHKGYTSGMWIDFDDNIVASYTVNVVLYGKQGTEIYVPAGSVSHIFIAATESATITCDGYTEVTLYDRKMDLQVKGQSKCIVSYATEDGDSWIGM